MRALGKGLGERCGCTPDGEQWFQAAGSDFLGTSGALRLGVVRCIGEPKAGR